jgi:hypothetical protein
MNAKDTPALMEEQCVHLEIVYNILWDDCDKLQPTKDELFERYSATKDPEILKLWLETQKVFSLFSQVQQQLRITALERDKPRDTKRSREERIK